MKRREKAKELFLLGYNCSQSVLGAFHDVVGLDFDTAMRLASSFGGGVARMRQICGTCSAMFMVAGFLKGYSTHDIQAKTAHYTLVQNMAKDFSGRNGSIVCKEILKLRAIPSRTVDNGDAPSANERTEEYYRSRPCLAVVEDAVNITCLYLGIDETFGTTS